VDDLAQQIYQRLKRYAAEAHRQVEAQATADADAFLARVMDMQRYGGRK
jgi:hypothetical protein